MTCTGSHVSELDFTKIEQAIISSLSEDNIDLHTEKASRIFRIPYDEVDTAQRRIGKLHNQLEWYS